MKAVGYQQSLPVQDPRSLLDVQMDPPGPGARDLLVRVQAISVNPVDTKLRRNLRTGRPGEPTGRLVRSGYAESGIANQIRCKRHGGK